MSRFPQLKPSARTLVVASTNVTNFVALSGKETRVILGDQAVAPTMQLEFSALDQDVAQLILSHYRGQLGTGISFDLPSEVWAGWPNYTAEIPANQKWRYSSTPRVVPVAPTRMNVSIELVGVD